MDARYSDPLDVDDMARRRQSLAGALQPRVPRRLRRVAAGTIFLSTDDCQASYEELKGRGVEFVEEPTEQPYGIDSSFRDPSGNHLRSAQVREIAAV